MSLDKHLRRSQAIRPYGPGAILELEGQSFAVCSADRWAYTPQWGRIEEPRLQKMLGKEFFAPPPEVVDDNAPGYIPVVRFPQWHFCPKCRIMTKLAVNAEKMCCVSCRDVDLVPMRFIMICPHGHMGDVPWERWVHRDPGIRCNAANSLKFYSTAETGGLDSVVIECGACKQKKSLLGITNEGAGRQIGLRCSGRQPWQPESEASQCQLVPYITQKGASNVHYSETRSSLDIPPHSSWRITGLRQSIITHRNYAMVGTLLANNIPVDNPLLQSAVAAIAMDLQIPVSDVRSIVSFEATGGAESQELLGGVDDLKRGEYRALITPVTQPHPKDNFVTTHFSGELHKIAAELKGKGDENAARAAQYVAGLVTKLVMVAKMRLVTANTGFYRVDHDQEKEFKTYNGGSDGAKMQPATLNESRAWLPGIENFGEGLFFSLDLQQLNKWEQFPAVKKRYAGREAPAFFLMHSLAHAFIRQASFEAGYSLSSICERLYCCSEQDGRTSMAGVLIYTASGDSEGSLGGLSRLARPERFLPVFMQAIRETDVCSNDPLCAESGGQGPDSRNLAACHACMLLPETSCEHFNSFLDRMALCGGIGGARGIAEDLNGKEIL